MCLAWSSFSTLAAFSTWMILGTYFTIKILVHLIEGSQYEQRARVRSVVRILAMGGSPRGLTSLSNTHNTVHHLNNRGFHVLVTEICLGCVGQP